MLTDVRTLAIFSARMLVARLFWARSQVLLVRLHSQPEESYREAIETDANDRFVQFARHYGDRKRHVARIALTRDRRLSELWQTTDGSPEMWREFRRQTRRRRREVMVTEGEVFDRADDGDLDRMVTRLVQSWERPNISISDLSEVRPGVWAPQGANIPLGIRFIGPTWLGVGRTLTDGASVRGPAAIWDDAVARPPVPETRWEGLDLTTPVVLHQVKKPSTRRRRSQRAFDICFSLLALAATLPLYPLIMLAIWIEDGRPFMFAHKRETLGGRQFGCLKFRSMRKDADRIKEQLLAKNQSDGPQFFMEDDPRVTRVGRFLRKSNLDELPQFFNVLRGDMAVVGPRPSPRKENQCCPGWREARLSVLPGVTGLWQVNRTRREGLDFQEWIKFDIEYVERASWRLDLLIIWKTLRLLAGR